MQNNSHTILKEWDALCDSLIEGTMAFDSRKSLPDDQKIDRYKLEDCSKELDLYLELSFSSPVEGFPPGIFDETPPVLEKALRVRIADATKILKKILEQHGGLVVQSEPDPAKTVRITFQKLLLPSPPKQEDCTWTSSVC